MYRERYENGYDLTHDEITTRGLRKTGYRHLLSPFALEGKQLRLHDRLVDCSMLPFLLRIPRLPQKPNPPVARPVDGKVLTSPENILLLEETAKKKKSAKGKKHVMEKKNHVESTCATRDEVTRYLFPWNAGKRAPLHQGNFTRPFPAIRKSKRWGWLSETSLSCFLCTAFADNC